METLNFGQDQFNQQFSAMFGNVLETDELINLITRQAAPQSVFYDIGACAGYYGIYFAHNLPLSRVYSFEPSPETFKALRDYFIKPFNLNNITPVQLAISDSNGQKVFNVSSDSARSSFSHDKAQSDNNKIISSNEVICFTVDALVESGLCAPPDIMKIDVEGHEFEVIKGSLNTLKSFSTKIFFEPHGTYEEVAKETETITQFLEPYGYVCESCGYPVFCHHK
jgi:FkbM family methyltransferase